MAFLLYYAITWFSIVHFAAGLRFSIPPFTNDEWVQRNAEVKDLLAPLHLELSQNDITPKAAAVRFSSTMANYFASHPDFIEEQNSKSFISHESRTLADARKKKNALRKVCFRRNATDEDRRNFRCAVRAVSFLKKKEREKQEHKTTAFQESQYRKDFWAFSKRVCSGNLESPAVKPSFTKYDADNYFPAKYSQPLHLNMSNLNWFPYIPVPYAEGSDFDLGPVTPKLVKSVLQKKKATSAPGYDGLMYGLFRNIPSTHHFLATLYSKLLLESNDPPEDWSQSKITLIHKSGDPNAPENFRMISLTSCISKIFHQILADRLVSYLTDNNFIDKSIQKAFIKNINGCIEHNEVLHEIIQHAKVKNRTVHVTFFDLADAFGSVSHDLISYSLNRYHVPDNLTTYIMNLYGRLQGSVTGPVWTSKQFQFRKGVFQGDPLSPVIFLACFNPILEHLDTLKQRSGYDLEGKKIITTPYADDFNLISGNKRTHQKIITQLNEYLLSMGLTLKPPKCRSLSISGGTPTDIPFFIGDTRIKSVKEDPHQFLGSHICFSGKSSDTYDFVKHELESKLKRLDEALIRPEYKVCVYVRYLLPSVRFLLTVHTLHKTHLESLDTLTDRYVKKWLGVPSRGANIALIHLPQGLDIPRLSDIYWKAHCLSYTRSRLLADEVVSVALDSRLQRESKWSNKQSTVTVCQSVHEAVVDQGSANDASWNTIKRKINSYLEDDIVSYWEDKIKPLLIQGNFPKLLLLQEENLTWKSIMFNLPRKVLSFAVNACIDSLPSYSNLCRWGKRLTDKCPFCPNTTGTLHHILAHCPTFLDRFTWRHNNVLMAIYRTIKETSAGNFNLYLDLEGYSVAGGTIPPHILVTSQRPDLVVVWEDMKKILLVELTVPFETNVQDAHDRKCERYKDLLSDLRETEYSVFYEAIEIGARGHVSKENKTRLKIIIDMCKCDIRPRNFISDISKHALLSSFVIFYSRKDQHWEKVQYLKL